MAHLKRFPLKAHHNKCSRRQVVRNFYNPFSCLTFFNSLFKIGHQIIRLFKPDGHTGVAGRNPPIGFLLTCHDARTGISE